jgi:23S rRNA (uridine2552-2'-O)-methyltransferase
VELGCWPGGWLQVLAEAVGPRGRVVGVDVAKVSELGPPVTALELDFTAPDAPERIAAALGRPADAVLSDAAPKLSGIRDVDRAAQEELCDAALHVAERVLRPGGAFVVKVFPGPETERFRAELRRRFGKVGAVRPEASRKTSKEFYLVAGAAPGGAEASARRARAARRGRAKP